MTDKSSACDPTVSSGVLVLPETLTWPGAANKIEAELIKAMEGHVPIIMSVDPTSMGCITYTSIHKHEGPRWKVSAS